jgi:serine/threonine protein kinase
MGNPAPASEPHEERELAARLGLRVEAVVETRAGRGGVVLKVRRPDDGEGLALKVSPAPDRTDPLAKAVQRREALIREAQVLRELGGPIGERFVAEGDLGPKRWLLTRWVEGDRLGRYRRLIIVPAEGAERRRLLLDVAVRFLSAVADLHARGYVHGDLQPDHAVRDGSGAIHLLDFELTHRPGDAAVPYRGGLVHYDAPEVAAGLLAGAERIRYDEVAEVYAAAAVLFCVAAGAPPGAYDLEASFEQRLEVIAAGRRRGFTECDSVAFPELERALEVGLAREPEQRYPAIAALLTAIVAIPR